MLFPLLLRNDVLDVDMQIQCLGDFSFHTAENAPGVNGGAAQHSSFFNDHDVFNPLIRSFNRTGDAGRSAAYDQVVDFRVKFTRRSLRFRRGAASGKKKGCQKG